MTSDTNPNLPLDAQTSAVARPAKTETAPFDPAAHLKTPEEIAYFLESAFEDGDAATVRHAIGVAARAHGMAQIAREAGLGRESLYKALSETGNPSLETIRAVLKALGLALTVKPVETDAA